MFPYYNKSEKNEEYKHRKRQETINSLFGESITTIHSPLRDVRDQIPKWIHDEFGSSESVFINFFQAYYDWLYSSGASGYNLGLGGFLNYLDLNTTPEILLKAYSKTFLPSFPENLIGSDDSSFGVPVENLRSFIKNVKTSLYHKKGTEESYQYFLRNLFGVTADFEYPGRLVFHLNRGKAEGEIYPKHGSHLNENPLMDGDWFQPFTYIINAVIDPDDPIFDDIFPNGDGVPIYADPIKSVLHPIGTKVLFETSLEDWEGPTGPDDIELVCEFPTLGNYLPYTLNTYETINSCTGCTLPYYNSNTDSDPLNDVAYPTHVFPDWDEPVGGGGNFGDINIGDFYEMCTILTSPNVGLTSCTELGC